MATLYELLKTRRNLQMSPQFYREDEVFDRLTPYFPIVYQAFIHAFEKYRQIATVIPNIKVRTKCDLIRSAVIHYLKLHLKNDPNSNIVEDRQDIIHIVLYDNYVLRLKKLNTLQRANFNTTSSSYEFINQQLTMEAITPDMIMLVLGYEPNITWTQLQRIYIKHPSDGWGFIVPQPTTRRNGEELADVEIANNLEQRRKIPRITPKLKVNNNGNKKIDQS